jgi:hypothetical protein
MQHNLKSIKMKVVVTSLVLASLTGCALSPMGTNSVGRKIDTTKFNEVQVCKTSKSELIGIFGAAEREGRQNGYNTLNWQYASVSFGGKGESQNVIVYLNNENVIVDYAINPVGLNFQPTDKCD